MNLTPKLKLKKPLTVEKYDVNVFNSNCDTVDSAVSNIIAGIENNTKETDKAIKELKENKADTAMVGAANGIAPLDSNRKIPPVNIPFGTITDTCFEGNMGKKLRDEFNSHINEFNSHINQSDASFKELENNLATETERAVMAENTLREELSSEAVMARNAEKENADAISAEIRRAQAAEEQIEGGLNLHMQSASTEFKSLHDTDDALESKKANKTDMEAALAERYTKDQTFSRQEILDKIEALIGSAPDTLDTFREIADALGNDPNFATTIMEALSGKVDKENGKALSSNDYSNDEKAKVQASYDIRHSHSNKTVLDKITQTFLDNWTDAYNKRHEHSNKGVLDGITSALITAWNSAVTHISDAVKHITATERTNWNDADSKKHIHDNKNILDSITQALITKWNSVGNKVDKVTGKGLSTNDYTTAEKQKLAGISTGAEVNSITGVKGNAESSYRTGNVNLTPENIGAAASSHTHTKSQITDMPTAMKNPASLIIQTNGTSQGSYDGSSAKTINITAANVGAATSSHSHSAYENQNAFSNITVGSTTLAADSITDTLTLVAGNNITLTPDVNNDKITIAATGGSTGNFASKSIYGDSSVSLGRVIGSTVGSNSFAFGTNLIASGKDSHAEGDKTKAEGWGAHAEGYNTTASKNYSHAEGYITKAELCAHAEGEATTASGNMSHAEGVNTTASGSASHAEGGGTEASGDMSHAEGLQTTASNYASNASGKYNASMISGGTFVNTTGTAFAIGNGTSDSVRSNAFSVMYTGVVKAKSTITGSTTADYAELFEWMDGNPENKDNAGYFVTLNGDKLKYASEGDYILGVISGEPFVLGNGDCDTWNGMYLRDNFNRVIYERAPMTVKNEKTGEYEEVKDADGNTLFYGTRPVLNPDYDPTEPYVSRIDRAEWDPVGMLGILSVYDDGTCEVNGYCKCNNDAIATKTDTGYRVIKRVADNIVRIIFR